MTPLTRTLLWIVAGGYMLVLSYRGVRNPSSDLPSFTSYVLIWRTGLAFFSAFDSYRKRGAGQLASQPSATPPRFTPRDRIAFKALGVPPALVGLIVLGVSCWLAWGQWITVSHWPRANAVLVSKDISSGGARLVFQYAVRGRQFTGHEFRWGPESAVRPALESYRPGTTQEISYDPEHPEDVQTILSYDWEGFKGPLVAAFLGLLLIAGGVSVFRWSSGSQAARRSD